MKYLAYALISPALAMILTKIVYLFTNIKNLEGKEKTKSIGCLIIIINLFIFGLLILFG